MWKKNKTESNDCIIGRVSCVSLLLAPIMPALKKMSAWKDFPSSRGMINGAILHRRTNKLSVCFLLRRCGTQEACWLENASLFGATRMGNFWWWTWVLPWARMGRKDSASGTAGVQWYINNTVGGSAREVEEEFSRYPQCHTSMKSYFLFLFSSPPPMAGVRLFSLSVRHHLSQCLPPLWRTVLGMWG